jgi:hypothetical protein
MHRTERCMSPIRTMIVFLGVMVVYAALGSVPASAARGHVFERSFGGPGSGAGQFEEPSGVAVDEAAGDWASGDVYVTTSSQERPEYDVVDVFRPGAGGKEPASTLAQIKGTPAEGEPATGEGKPFVGPHGVAVDSLNGDVVVADEDVVDVFEPEPGMPGIYRYLFDITGTPAGSFEDVGGSEGVKGVTVDGGKGAIFVWGAEAGEDVVDEFRLAGGGVSTEFVGRLTGTPAGPFEDVQSVAVDDDPSSSTYGDVFVGDYRAEAGAGVVDVFGPDVVVPDVTTEPASGSQIEPKTHTFSSVLNGTVNPAEAGEATCEFVWGLSTSELTKTAECEGPGSKATPVPNGNTPVPVHAKLEGLTADTKYFYRLQASNVHEGQVETNTGEGAADEGSFTTPGPGIEEESVSEVGSSSAALEATVDPDKGATSYYFQYNKTGTESCGESPSSCTSMPTSPGHGIGSGEAEVKFAEHIQELASGTTYHYRVVAVSGIEVAPEVFEAETFYGPDETFTTQGTRGVSLPDGREWEMVSSPEKQGASFEPIAEQKVVQAAANGGALSYLAFAPTEVGPQGNSHGVQVLSTRGPGGTWESRDLTVPHVGATDGSVGLGQEYRFFSEDLSVGIVQPFGAFTPCLSPEASEQTAYLRTNFTKSPSGELVPCTSNCYQPLVTGCPASPAPCPAGVEEHADVPPGTVFGEAGEVQARSPCPPPRADLWPGIRGRRGTEMGPR